MCAVCVFSACAAFSRAAVSEVRICASGSVVLPDGTICVAAGSWLEEVTADAVTSGWMVERSTSSSSVTTALAIGSAAIGSDAGTCSGAVWMQELRFPEEYFPVPAVPKQMAVPRSGFLPVRMAVPERMVLERPVLPELPVQMALLEEMAPGQLPVFPGLRYSKQEKSSPPKNP